ncbi:hypothetical protein LIA77_11880 [Sarocladium implicatum]|nr:hypothetical protein LIA77_11880 [Sarocladium implicatum]
MPLIPYMGGGMPGAVNSMTTSSMLVNLTSATPTPVIASAPTPTTSTHSTLSSEEVQALVDAMGTFPLPGVLNLAGNLPLNYIKRSGSSNDTDERAVKPNSTDPKPLSEEQVQALLKVADNMMRQKLFQVGLTNERPPLPTDPDVVKLNDMVTAILGPDDDNPAAANASTPEHPHQKRFMLPNEQFAKYTKSGEPWREAQPWGVMWDAKDWKAKQARERDAMYTNYMLAVGLDPTKGGNLPWLTIKETLTKTVKKPTTVTEPTTVTKPTTVRTTVTAMPNACVPARASRPMKLPGLNAPDGNPRNPLNFIPINIYPSSTAMEPAPTTMGTTTTTTTSEEEAAFTEPPKVDVSSAKDSGLAVVVLDPHDGKEVETLRQLIKDAGDTPGAMGPGPANENNPFPAAPPPGAPDPDDLYPGAPYPGDPYADFDPYPGAPYPGAPYPGAPFPGAPFPGAPYPGAPYPGAPYPGAPYPGPPYPGPPFPAWAGPGAPAAPPPFPPTDIQRQARDVPPPASTPLPAPHSKRSVDSPVQSFLHVPDPLRWKYKPKEGKFHPPGSSHKLHKLKPASIAKLAKGHLHARRDQCTSTGCMLRDGGIIYGLMGGSLIAVIILALLIGAVVKIVGLVKAVMARRKMRRDVEAAGMSLEGGRDIESQHLVQIPQPAALK